MKNVTDIICTMDTDKAIQLLEDALIAWRTMQTKKKDSVSINKFAEYLGISKALLIALQQKDRNFTHETCKKIAKPIADLVGPQSYEILEVTPPNPYLQKINQLFPRLSPERQRVLAEDAARYETEEHVNAKETHRKRKTSRHS